MTVPVFYSISDDFTKYAAVSLNSLVKHADPATDYTVYFLSQDLSDQHKQDLSDLGSQNVHVKFSYIDDELVKPIQNRKENFLRADFFTMSIFYRLFIPELFPQYDKAIYIDSDTIVNDAIAKLYNTELGNNLFGACTDSSIQYVAEMVKYIKDVLALDPKKYINSGMLVMNCKAFRDEHFIDHFMVLLEKYHFDCIAPDQDYLNEIGEGRILHLDPRWDAMPNENTEPLKDPGLIHYNLFFKPWHFKNVQYEDYFWQSAKETKFYNELKAELDSYTDAERADDREKLNHMLLKEKKTEQDPNNWTRVKEREAVTL
ncbi:glycosyltransferase family 8 protein [Lactobacillus helveticus]|uniref:Glucosyltransferase n=1 Tax=Lactobacillus helveticus TaxID=1587 RepID=A0A8H9KGB8_LACHE|nr:glycosyltransferase family 8 protein [Lactobacillus helveticus]KRO14902.1 lipopolysaccharide biosynthesis glycosyltransferase [Lactobacillus helveticus]MBW8062199.1 glycosyltransferase family 8 protein [Lactobacillus helveticus]GFO99736.1 glucosyltransferase [Lactobacillus helveticus]GFP00927.1 glucosyltransferase [Lactobacillus helveticus]GFP03785.1 glucosyltransferase [Lactobacillus helveticus]